MENLHNSCSKYKHWHKHHSVLTETHTHTNHVCRVFYSSNATVLHKKTVFIHITLSFHINTDDLLWFIHQKCLSYQWQLPCPRLQYKMFKDLCLPYLFSRSMSFCLTSLHSFYSWVNHYVVILAIDLTVKLYFLCRTNASLTWFCSCMIHCISWILSHILSCIGTGV